MVRHFCHCVSAVALTLATAFVATAAFAGSPQPPVNGMRPADLRTHAITDAKVVAAPGEVLERATIIIRRGVIDAVGPDLEVPAGAWVWPGEGLTVYAGLIDAAVLVRANANSDSAGAHWNSRIRPEISMLEQPVPPANVRRDLRSLGFTAAAVYPDQGIFRGSGVVLALAEDSEHVFAYTDRAAMAAGFDFGGRRGDTSYPGSLMGAIALMRQTLLDAQWHDESRRAYAADPRGKEPPVRADALAALANVVAGNQAVLFDAGDELNALRAGKVADEFNVNMMLLGSGMEFRRLDPIVAMNMPIIVPLRFPERPNVSTLAQAERTSLRDLQTWEQAPTNARRLVDAGATIALTTHRLQRRSGFPAAVRSAIQHGLSEDDALAALTTTPARLLGIDHIAGTIESGKIANLVVVKGSLFDKDAKVRDTWINGRRYEISADPDITFEATGLLRTDTGIERKIDLNTTRSRATLHTTDDKKVQAQRVVVQRDHVSLVVDGAHLDADAAPGYARLSGVISGGIVTGTGAMADGSRFAFTIEPVEEATEEDAEQAEAEGEDAPAADADAPSAPDAPQNISGQWAISVSIEGMDEPIAVTLTLEQHDDGSITGTSTAMGMDMPVSNAVYDASSGQLTYQIQTPGGLVDITATIEGDRISGSSTGADVVSTFTGTRAGAARTAGRGRGAGRGAQDPDKFEMPPDALTFPLGEYGLARPPVPQNVMVRNATIWTAGPHGIIEEGILLAIDGKTAFVGSADEWDRSNSPYKVRSDLTMIDAAGKHITPGLIDCHSHTGISSGVNEWTQVNTAEVRIADVINPDDVNWYRQLAGGLTAANQLHGSANPIGGQNSVVKLRWGAAAADDMLVDDAIPGIKFALGENVVRTTSRYPNTRMGVETVLRDAFTAAREYEARRNNPNNAMPVRRDLTLDALVDILNGDMLVHCHSYRQDEILMLIRVAEDFGFTVGTFQHVLEGYKVAEAIAAHQRDTHGAGASAFSDWWGYKVEVQDAIPHAGALMHHVGVNVSFNSDSSEVARRMNTEAAKAVRYGGVSPEEALKFVTLNPAAQLRIDHRTGSLEVGKDADFVIWSGDPLSTYARAEQTWIEGARYFDLDTDRELRAHIEAERQRLIQKILTAQHGDAASGDNEDAAANEEQAAEPTRVARGENRLMQRLLDNRVQMMAEQYRLGRDPEEIRPGECGCNDWWYQLR